MKIERNYNAFWKAIIKNEKFTSPLKLKPGNFYKIVTYKYSSGETKSLAGPKESYIFLLGRYIKNKIEYVTSIKLKYVEPKVFFHNLKIFYNPNPMDSAKIDEEYKSIKDEKNDEFSSLLKKISKDGKNIFSVIRTKTKLYQGYREYIIKNIKQAAFIDLDPEYLKTVMTITSAKNKNLQKERKMTNVRNAVVAKEANKPKNIEK